MIVFNSTIWNGAMGWGSSVDVVELLQYLFLNVYLITAAIFVIIGGILVAIGRKRKKHT